MSSAKISINIVSRKKAVNSAIWSVKAEGLKPTKSAKENLRQYASGRISVSEMRSKALSNAQSIAKASR